MSFDDDDSGPIRPEGPPAPRLRIPAPRTPGGWSASPPPAPAPVPPEAGQRTGHDGRRGRVIGAAVVVLALIAVVLVAVLTNQKDGPVPVAAATTTDSAAASSGAGADPAADALATLQTQAAALLRGDQAGWLAAAVPGVVSTHDELVKRYRMLTGRRISQLDYAFYRKPYVLPGDPTFKAEVMEGVCFSMPSCPAPVTGLGIPLGAPKILEEFTFRLTAGRYLIDTVETAQESDKYQPMAWERGDLVIAQGRRVTVAASPSEAKRLPEAVAAADQAAAVADRFAGLFHNPVGRYRIYLADDQDWKVWFGGAPEKGVSGVTQLINEVQAEVVIKMSDNGPRAELANTIQHEMGHVVSLGHRNVSGTR